MNADNGNRGNPKGIGPKRRSTLETVRKFARAVSQACAGCRNEIDQIDEDIAALEYAYQRVGCECEDMLWHGAPYRKPDLRRTPLPPHWYMAKYDAAMCSSCGCDMWTGFNTTQEATERWHELYERWRFCPKCGRPMIDPDGFPKTDD